MSRFLLSAWLLLAGLAPISVSAQQPAPAFTRPVVVSSVVGEVIDQQEKATYGLFPYYSANDFVEARFEQMLALDSAVRLRTLFRDGRTVLRPFTPAELATVRATITARQQELSRLPATASGSPTDSIGRRFQVTLRTGTTFDGELIARRPTQLEFMTTDLGVVQIDRANIARLTELTSNLGSRHNNWFSAGNGTRVFFAPTARNLRAGEGYFQTIDVFLLGVNYGLTDNLSFGILASAIPGLSLSDQLIAFTPKFSTPINEKVSVGAGLLYARIPLYNSMGSGYGAGVAYGLVTVGSADNNLTFGLGYGFSGGAEQDRGFGKSPVAVLSGATRVSRRLSLMSENYLITAGNGGLGGLYGVRINWPRTTFGIGSFYLAPFQEEGVFGYVYPVYLDLAFRFGKDVRK